MWLLKLPFKILALPVILLLGVFWVLGKIMTNLSAFVVGIFMLFIFLVGVFCAFQGQWGNVAFLIGVEVACLVLQYGAMMIVDISGSIKGALVGFFIPEKSCMDKNLSENTAKAFIRSWK